MFEISIIGKKKKTCYILIHGLFSNPGFWLKHLPFFKDSCLILISVKYALLPNINDYIPALRCELERFLEDKACTKLIAHSLGSYVALKLGKISSVKSYHICPVHSAVRKNQENFIKLMCEMQAHFNIHEVTDILKKVSNHLASDHKNVVNFYLKKSHIFIPNDDPFFEYQLSGGEIIFKGDHFEIDTALIKIVEN